MTTQCHSLAAHSIIVIIRCISIVLPLTMHCRAMTLTCPWMTNLRRKKQYMLNTLVLCINPANVMLIVCLGVFMMPVYVVYINCPRGTFLAVMSHGVYVYETQASQRDNYEAVEAIACMLWRKYNLSQSGAKLRCNYFGILQY